MRKILPRKVRICANPNCNKEFFRENWRPDIFCCKKCALSVTINPMKGSSLEELLIKKYGQEIGALKFIETRNKQSISASNYLQSLSPEERKRVRGRYGSNSGLFNKSFYDIWIVKYGKEIADEKMINYSIQKAKDSTGRKKSNEEIAKIRLSKIKRIEEKIKTKISPRYNPYACIIIDTYGKNNGYNFQHAENGGEFFVKTIGCFLDGYDQENNIVIEFYERFHYKINGELKEKDARREEAIIAALNCRFIRINAFKKHELKIEIITL